MAIIRYKTLKTNYDKTLTYRISGDYSDKDFFMDICNSENTKLFSATISLTYAEATDKTTIVILISKAQIATLSIGTQYYADLKLDDTIEYHWLSFIFDVEYGNTASCV
jgi:hypothetical protein